MIRSLAAAAALALFLSAHAADLANQFVTAKLAHGASLSVPRAWTVIDGNERRSLETVVGAAADLTGYAHAMQGTESLLVANFPDSARYASVTVTTSDLPSATPAMIDSITDAQVTGMDAQFHQGVVAMQSRLGAQVANWKPYAKTQIGGRTMLAGGYTRVTDQGETLVRLYKIFGTGRFYDIVLSTRASAVRGNSIILDRVITSFAAP